MSKSKYMYQVAEENSEEEEDDSNKNNNNKIKNENGDLELSSSSEEESNLTHLKKYYSVKKLEENNNNEQQDEKGERSDGSDYKNSPRTNSPNINQKAYTPGGEEEEEEEESEHEKEEKQPEKNTPSSLATKHITVKKKEKKVTTKVRDIPLEKKDVINWVRELGLKEAPIHLDKNDIDGAKLVTLDVNALQRIGLPESEAIRLIKEIEQLKSSSPTFDWNNAFQEILEDNDTSERKRKQREVELSSLYRDFVYAAKTYGRIIISEKYVPIYQKVITPFDAGGRAGGVKYKAHGILFKFQIDTYDDKYDFWMYGIKQRSDHYAAKAAGHELKGLINTFNTRVVANKIHYPLMALIDYRGFRLIALSWLPIDKSTLVYGSHDGGETTKASDPVVNTEMKKIGMALNLEGHHVGDQKKLIWLCGDIEVHRGYDHRFYCLDFARVFPPEKLPKNESIYEEKDKYNYHLFKLLRSELVKSNEIRLNSDARSNFINRKDYPELKEFAKASSGILAATKRLLTQVIPDFAAYFTSVQAIKFDKKDSSFNLTNEIHRVGINCRHLGRVRRHLIHNEKRQKFVLNEIVARTTKNHLRQLWREKMEERRVPVSEPYIEVTTNYFNLLLQDKDYWKNPTRLKAEINEYFNRALTENEMDPLHNLNSQINYFNLFNRIQTLTGVKLSKEINNLLARQSGHSQITFLKVDITLSAKVTQFDLIHMSEGKMLFHQAQEPENSHEQINRLFKLAYDRFESGIAMNPNNPEILLWWASTLELESKSADTRTAKVLLERAAEKLSHCCRLVPQSHGAKLASVSVLIRLAVMTMDRNHKYKYLVTAQEYLADIFKENQSYFENNAFQEVIDSYNQLGIVELEDNIESQNMPTRLTIQQREVNLNEYLVAYYWHHLVLQFVNSPVLLIHVASILIRCASLTDKPVLAQEFFSKAGQVLEVILLDSALTINLRNPDDKSTDQLKPYYLWIEMETEQTRLRKMEGRESLRTNLYASGRKTSPDISETKLTTSGNSSLEKEEKVVLKGKVEVLETKRLKSNWKKKYVTATRRGLFMSDKPDQKSEPEYLLRDARISLGLEVKGRRNCFKLSFEHLKVDLIFYVGTEVELNEWMIFFNELNDSQPLNLSNIEKSEDSKSSEDIQKNRKFEIVLLSKGRSKLHRSDQEILQERQLVPTVLGELSTDVSQAVPLEHLFFNTFKLSSSVSMIFTVDFSISTLNKLELHQLTKLRTESDSVSIHLIIFAFSKPPRKDISEVLKGLSTYDDIKKFASRRHKGLKRFKLEKLTSGKKTITLQNLRGTHYFLKIDIVSNTTLDLHLDFFGTLNARAHLPTSTKLAQLLTDTSERSDRDQSRQYSREEDVRESRSSRHLTTESKSDSIDSPTGRSILSPSLAIIPKKNIPSKIGSTDLSATMRASLASSQKNQGQKATLSIDKIFVQYNCLAAVLRLVENSPVLHNILPHVVKLNNNKENKNDVTSFIAHNNSYIDPFMTKDICEIDLSHLNLSRSQLVNRFVLDNLTKWINPPPGHIDLSFTSITDSDLLRVISNCGQHLLSIQLKGCSALTSQTIVNLAQYCTKLSFLGMWDVTIPDKQVDILGSVAKLKVPMLDISHCSEVSRNFFRNLHSDITYLDLSYIQTYKKEPFDKNSLQLLGRKQKLEALILRRPRDDPLDKLFDDECLTQVFNQNRCLKFVDLSDCVHITDKLLHSFASKELRSLKLLGTRNITGNGLAKLLTDSSHLTEFEHYLYGGSSIKNLASICEPLSKLKYLTHLTLRSNKLNDHYLEPVINACASNLVKLDLSLCLISDVTGDQVAKCTSLVELHLGGCYKLKKNTINNICRACKKLIIVDFSGCPIKDETMKILLVETMEQKKSLHTLKISGCERPTDLTLEYLENHTELQFLKLPTHVTVPAVTKLASFIPRLKVLDASKCAYFPKSSDDTSTWFNNLQKDLCKLLPNTAIVLEN